MGGTFSRLSYYEEEYQEIIANINNTWDLKYEHKKLLEERVDSPCTIAKLPENAKKNRGSNHCFDFNRVVLLDSKGSDFINASWIDGHNEPGKYLLCQSPLQETVQDWYSMLFTYKIRVIVMLNSIIEQDQEACFPYWSQVQQTSVNFGRFRVKTSKVNVYQDHVVTHLHVRHGRRASLKVTHFFYTNWPPQKVPQNPLGFCSFLEKARKAQYRAELHESDVLPMLVHSRTGLNRAAAFVAIDICLEQSSECETADLASVTRCLRKQRRNCLSLQEHYLFCHSIVSKFSL